MQIHKIGNQMQKLISVSDGSSHKCCVFLYVIFVWLLFCFYICVCVCVWISIAEVPFDSAGASGLPYYCAPRVCVPVVIGGLVVWWYKNPRSRKTFKWWAEILLQCVAVCCSVLQCARLCCSALQCCRQTQRRYAPCYRFRSAPRWPHWWSRIYSLRGWQRGRGDLLLILAKIRK